LCPYLDSESVICIKTKTLKITDIGELGISAILTSRQPVVEMLVLRANKEACHVGVSESFEKEVLETQK